MKKKIINLSLACWLATGISLGQTTPPTIEWQKEYWAPTHPNNNTQQTQQESSEDWFYGIEQSEDNNGNQNGYICVGYSRYTNWYNTQPGDCYNQPLSNPAFDELEYTGWIKGDIISTVSLIDNDGKTVWYKNYIPGAEFFNVIQTSDGGYIAVGKTRSIQDMNGSPLQYNPDHPAQYPNEFFTSISCSSTADPDPTTSIRGIDKALVVKMNANGNVEWQYIYGMEQFDAPNDGENAYKLGSIAWDIVETPDGDFRFVGCSTDPNNFEINPVFGNTQNTMRTFMVEIDHLGNWRGGDFYGPTDQFSVGMSIERKKYGTRTKYIIAGEQRVNPFTDPDPNGTGLDWGIVKTNHDRSAFVFLIDELPSTTPNFTQTYPPQWSSLPNGFGYYGNPNGFTRATDVSVINNGEIVLPVGNNCDKCAYGWSGTAEGTVYRINPLNGQTLSTSQLGTIKAYDLKVGITATSDGGFAVVSTKQNIRPFSSGDLDPYNTNIFSGALLDATEVWRTDTYIAKFDALGVKIWEKTYDSHSESPSGPSSSWSFPTATIAQSSRLDLKRQECMYDIIETDDGGYAIAGNTSSNFDDSYVIKFNSCEKETLAPLTGVTVNNQNTNTLILDNSSRTYTNASVIIASAADVRNQSELDLVAGESILFLPSTFIEGASKLAASIDLKMDCDPFSNKSGRETQDVAYSFEIEQNLFNKSKKDFDIYPNPAKNIINIDFKGIENDVENLIQIYNMQGNIVSSATVINLPETLSIDIAELAKGMYMVVLSNKENTVTQKFTKE